MNETLYSYSKSDWRVVRKLMLILPEKMCQMLYSSCREEYGISDYTALCRKIEETDEVHLIDRDSFRKNMDIAQIGRRLETQERYEFQYRADHAGGIDWYTVRISVQERMDGRPRVAAIETVQQPILFWNTKENSEKLSELARVCFRGFGLAYYNIILADIDNNSYLVQNPFGDDVFRNVETCPVGNYIEDNIGYATNFIHPDDRALFLEHTSLDGYRKYVPEPQQHDTFRLRHVLNGEYRWVAVHAVHLTHTAGNFLVLYWVEDIQQQVEREQQTIERLNDAVWQAHQANQAKTDFLGRITHDLRTPLNGILGMLDIAGAQKENPDVLADCERKIRSSAEYLLSLISDLLDISKMEQGKLTLQKESFDLGQLYGECYDILQPVAASRGIALFMEPALSGVPVLGCPKQMRQILVNLVSNAVKYNKPDGSVTVTAKIVSREESTLFVQYCVSDTGIGMSEEFMKVMFEPFERDAAVEKSNIEGVGLGLPIVFRLVQEMGGNIDVKSQPGEGSTFTVTMPFEQLEKSAEPEQKGEQMPDLSGKRILIVDDNAINREILGFVFEKYHPQIDMAENGREAVDLFEQSADGSYYMIFMDIQMPVMNGNEAAAAIRAGNRADAKSIPIIALSAGGSGEEQEEYQKAGMQASLGKPVDPKALEALLNKYLREGLA